MYTSSIEAITQISCNNNSYWELYLPMHRALPPSVNVYARCPGKPYIVYHHHSLRSQDTGRQQAKQTTFLLLQVLVAQLCLNRLEPFEQLLQHLVLPFTLFKLLFPHPGSRFQFQTPGCLCLLVLLFLFLLGIDVIIEDHP